MKTKPTKKERARDRAIAKEQRARAPQNAVWEAADAAKKAEQARIEAACQRAWDASGEAKVYVEFLPSEHGRGYVACVESSRRNWRRLFRDLQGIARVREVMGATNKREAFAAEVVAFFQAGGVRFVDRPEPARNNMALSRPWWTARSGNYEGDVPRLRLDYTMAERVLRLREMAQESLARGEGHMARLQAICARDYRRQHFPSRERQARAMELEQPCPALPMPSPAALSEEYDNLYVAHFGADRKAAA